MNRMKERMLIDQNLREKHFIKTWIFNKKIKIKNHFLHFLMVYNFLFGPALNLTEIIW